MAVNREVWIYPRLRELVLSVLFGVHCYLYFALRIGTTGEEEWERQHRHFFEEGEEETPPQRVGSSLLLRASAPGMSGWGLWER